MRVSLLLAALFAVGCRTTVEDADSDGVPAEEDCDDTNAEVRPGAPELCNGVDDDCDGDIDEEAADAPTTYADADGDGHGDAASPTTACEAPAGNVETADDCDDAVASTFPGAEETCNEVDDDCDSTVDEDPTDASTFYADGDEDGFGAEAIAVTGCEAPPGFTAEAGDCDDADARFFPGADESNCEDPNDYNCDGSSGYADADEDGHAACADCDDGNAAIHPEAAEACNGADDDCDGDTDEAGSVGESVWFGDGDGDGFGRSSNRQSACAAPEGFVSDGTDCNDEAAAAYPGGAEVCDGLDNDCNGQTDEPAASDAATWYGDGDGDGYGVASRTTVACAQPPGFAAQAGDCDDARAIVAPGAEEICDALDNDCNGQTDEGFDADEDGVTACAGDCDESRADVRPGATEVCDGVDNDCDGTSDLNATDAPTWYIDYDDDGYGVERITAEACAQPEGFADNAEDCDDVNANRNPAAAEVCDGRDMNCDGDVDNDDDGDGHPAASCGGTDCDDARADVKPGAAEVTYDGVDNDCDPATLDDDLDEDGFVGAEDCDDTDPDINPGESEVWYDGIDQDCDGANDYDQDGDGHEAVAEGGDDCNDTDPSVWNTCTDGISQASAGRTCLQIHQDYPSAADGTYWLDPNGGSTGDAYQARCDMNDDGGGWTLIARFSNADAKNWMSDQGEWWYDQSSAVGNTLVTNVNADMISPAFWTLGAAELRITSSAAANDAHLLRTTSNCLSGQNFRTRLRGFGTFRGTTAWASDAVRHTCAATVGGSYASTQGFAQANCSGNIGAPRTLSFYSDWSQGDGAVMMIGGGGNNCNRADHGIGVTEANSASFGGISTSSESDFGDSAPTGDPGYALNLWVR
jgi:hypothetical protein